MILKTFIALFPGKCCFVTASDKRFVLGSDETHLKDGTYKGMYLVNFHAGFLNWVILLFI